MDETHEVKGVEQIEKDDRGKYPYDEALIVAFGSTTKQIPITNIQLSAYGCYGPSLDYSIETVNIDRVTVDGGNLFGEAELADGAVLDLFQELDSGRWCFHHWPDGGTDPGFDIIWERCTHD